MPEVAIGYILKKVFGRTPKHVSLFSFQRVFSQNDHKCTGSLLLYIVPCMCGIHAIKHGTAAPVSRVDHTIEFAVFVWVAPQQPASFLSSMQAVSPSALLSLSTSGHQSLAIYPLASSRPSLSHQSAHAVSLIIPICAPLITVLLRSGVV